MVGGLLHGWGVPVFILAVAVYLTKSLVDAWRAKRFATTFKAEIPFKVILKTNLQAVAFDFVLPVPQAEEIYRFGKFSTYIEKGEAILLILGIKVTGLLATCITLGLTVIFTTLGLRRLSMFDHPALSLTILFDVLLLLSLAGIYLGWQYRKDNQFIRSRIDWFRSVWRLFKKNQWAFVESILLSLCSQLIYAVAIYLFVALCPCFYILFYGFSDRASRIFRRFGTYRYSRAGSKGGYHSLGADAVWRALDYRLERGCFSSRPHGALYRTGGSSIFK